MCPLFIWIAMEEMQGDVFQNFRDRPRCHQGLATARRMLNATRRGFSILMNLK